jgi:oxaloacetate decarboxylase alpha subunit
VGYPPLVTPLSQIVGTQAVINVLTGKRCAVVPQEMKDYIRGYYGKAPGPMDEEIVAKVLGDEEPLPPDVRPGSLVTTTYEEMEAEIGGLARSEEDVLMYALFPNEARDYLQRHRSGAESTVFLLSPHAEVAREDDSVNVEQIRELVRLVESSEVTEVVVEEGDTRVVVRKGGVSAEPEARPARPASGAEDALPPSPESPQVTDEPGSFEERPAEWKPVVAPMVGTFYAAPAPGAPPFVKVGDRVHEGQTLCIVEAMKLMNEIAAEEDCIIREVVADNAQPVEYGTVLFYYEPVG